MRRFYAAALLLCAFVLFLSRAVQAREVTVRGTDMGRYGRILLQFDTAPEVSLRNNNGIFVVTFSEAVTIRSERLASDLGNFISQVRRDPDGKGMRIATTRNFRPNVLEAGDRIYIDLLPESWTGLTPGLPAEVVDDLAKRAKQAETLQAAEALRQKSQKSRPITVRSARLPNLTRLIFEAPVNTALSYSVTDTGADILFDGLFSLDPREARAKFPGVVNQIETEQLPNGFTTRLMFAKGLKARAFREEDALIIDLTDPVKTAQVKLDDNKPLQEVSGKPPSVETPSQNFSSEKKENSQKPEEGSAENPLPKWGENAPHKRAEKPAEKPLRNLATPQELVVPIAEQSDNVFKISFPFTHKTPAAAFEKDGIVTLVFRSNEPVQPFRGVFREGAPLQFLNLTREGSFVVVRFESAGTGVVRLVPEGMAWILGFSETGIAAVEPLVPVRAIDEAGRTVVGVALADANGVHWYEDPLNGAKLAIVTSEGTPRGMAKNQRFVEFQFLPSLHGLVVLAEADDVTVRTEIDQVIVSRGSGLSVSLVNMGKGGEGSPLDKLTPVIDRKKWAEDAAGDLLTRQRDALQRSLDASRSTRNRTRMEMARVLMAGGMNIEAIGAMDAAALDDPILRRDRDYLILRSIASLGLARHADARKHLAFETLSEDPEAYLWLAMVDAGEKNWGRALAAFRRSAAVMDIYPDDLQGKLRSMAARAAIAMRDFAYAENELNAMRQLTPGSVSRDEMLFLRAQIDQAVGRPELALETYRFLMDNADRALAVEARFAHTEAALHEKVITTEDAIAQYELLSAIWRKDEIEAASLARLGRLYAEAGRWRESFLTSRQLNAYYPHYPAARTLYDETARLFEELFLTGKGDSLSKVEALALFFDFREYTPIGRRGDEIVRRLADRLVALDLLGRAGELLQHQVDNRLYGAARSTVAARLATIRLMDGKPDLALKALQNTRLPELPETIRRARLLLEARALSDLSRTDLAMEVVTAETGVDVERLRADILWQGRRWKEAGEAHEQLAGQGWRSSQALSERARIDVVRAAIAYSLGEEVLSLDRLRTRYTEKMADSPDAKTFAHLTRPNAVTTRAFRDIARTVTSADTLADFLSEYRKRYPEASTVDRPPRSAAVPQSDAASTTPVAPPG
jgi:tetratricopeptide (TPR) repeat protein